MFYPNEEKKKKKKQNSFINSFCGNCCINGDDIKISNCSVMECAAHLCLAVLILTTGFSDALVRIWRTYWRKEATPYLPKQQPCLGSSIFFVFLTDHVDPTCSLPARSTVLCYETENVFLLAFPGGPHLSLNSASSSEVSVWILGAPCVHNLSSRVCVFYLRPERLWFTLSNGGGQWRSCEFSQTTAQGSVEMQKINWGVCYGALVAFYL